MLGLSSVSNAGALAAITKLSVTDGAAVSHSLTAGKTGVILMNVGTSIAWFGGSTVDPGNSKGCEVLPKVQLIFNACTEGFKIFFKCDTSLSTTIGIVEF